jgi:hypothetical protein
MITSEDLIHKDIVKLYRIWWHFVIPMLGIKRIYSKSIIEGS